LALYGFSLMKSCAAISLLHSLRQINRSKRTSAGVSRVIGGMLGKLVGTSGGERPFPGMYATDGLQQFLVQAIF